MEPVLSRGEVFEMRRLFGIEAEGKGDHFRQPALGKAKVFSNGRRGQNL
jgi:hypothetical protein